MSLKIYSDSGLDMGVTKNGGTIYTIDMNHREPSIETLLDKLDLRHLVKIHYSDCNWQLMKWIESNEVTFDMCYFDGGHTWAVTGYDFLLVDILMKKGGWVIFDDLTWTMKNIQKPWALRRSKQERITPQIKKVWELLVKRHRNYSNFQEIKDLPGTTWGIAQKVKEDRDIK